jgi:hypothetical protein
MRPLLLCWIFLGCLLVSCRPHSQAGRVQVGLLDGAPVYHWANFPSGYHDDIARALILREFQRQGFHLPQAFVDQAVKEKVDKDYGGDQVKFLASLQDIGETLANYRQFTGEEIILKAMRKRETIVGHDGHPPISEKEWLTSLRQGARIEMINGEQ